MILRTDSSNLARFRRRQRLQTVVMATIGICVLILVGYIITRCIIDINNSQL